MRSSKLKSVVAPSLLLYGASCGEVVATDPANKAPVNANSAGTVAEGGTLALTGVLVSADADTAADGLVYTVATLPADGEVMRDGVALAEGDTFTQKEVNEGKLSYVHDGAERTSDEFTWTLSDGDNQIGPMPFAITVTPVNDAPLIVNNPLTTLAEGGTDVLTDAKLLVSDVETPSALTYTLVGATHGRLEKKVADTFTPMVANDTFTQQDITDGNIRFVDSGVDDANLAQGQNTLASFSWRVEDGDGGVNPSPTTSNVTSFTVTPVDDPPVVNWVANRCHVANVAINANPIVSLTDPDNTASQYQICVVSIGNATTINYTTGATIGTTSTFAPTLKNGATPLAVNSCVTASALTGLTLTSPANDHGGSVSWRLMKGGVQVGNPHTMTFPMSKPPCP